MTGWLLPTLAFRAVDANGVPMSGAKLQFYVSGTTNPATTYYSAALGSPLPNPVISDSGGLFVPIYLDPTVQYRIQLLTSAGSLITDIDPATTGFVAATQAQVNAGTNSTAYVTPQTLASWAGVLAALGYTPVNRGGDTATNLLISNSVLNASSAGYLGAPVNEQDANYIFVPGDSGKMVRANNAGAITYTIPPVSAVAWPAGTMIIVRNVGAGVVTLTRGAGVAQLLAGGSTNKDVAVAQWGFATLIMETTNNWIVSGSGIS